MKLAAPVTLATALCACAGTPQNAANAPAWRCADGASFTVRHVDTRTVAIAVDGETFRLDAMPAGSGIHYSNGVVDYREHQGESILDGIAGGSHRGCRRED